MKPTAAEPKYFRAAGATGTAPKVERDGGRYGFGVLRGASVITRGEALGHELWIDQDFLSDVTAAINASETGVKARFTHPGLSSDGVGSKLGRFFDARMEGDQVFADLHFQEAATKTPDGDLADYTMTLAEETPEDFGLSIVFERDMDAEDELLSDNTVSQGNRSIFTSPDELNRNNYRHARLSHLRAGDVVDSPAANPDGLFQRGQEAAQQGEQLLEYALGLSDEKPGGTMFNVDGDRAKQFLSRFLSRHSLSVSKGDATVSETKPDAVESPAAETVDANDLRKQFNADLTRYKERFGAENGVEWFTAGKSWEEALELHCIETEKALAAATAEVDQLQETLKSLDRGEDEGAEFTPADVKPTATQERPAKRAIRLSGKSYPESN